MIYSELRRQLDDAITFGENRKARQIADTGLARGTEEENLGEIMYFRAQHAILAEDFSAAIGCLDEAIRYNPADGAAYNDRALCRIDSGGNLMAALADFDKGIEVEPDYATIYHNKGWYLNQLGHSREAIEYLQKALELEPDRAVTYENLADVYFRLGDKASALGAYAKSLELLADSYPEISEQIRAKIATLNQKAT